MNNIHLNLKITNVTEENRRDKFTAATEQLAKAMRMPVTIRPKSDDSVSEEYAYQAQDEFTRDMLLHVAGMMDDIYHATCEYLDLPVVHTFRKGFFDRFLTVKGKLRFNPETGKPLKWDDFYKLVRAIDKFLNLGTKPMSMRLVLGSESLARLLHFIGENTTDKDARRATMANLDGRGYNFGKLSDSLKEFTEHFQLSEPEVERLGIVERQVGDWFADLGNQTLKRVKDTYYEGVIQKLPKSQISQNLFDRFGDQNRDWRRVVETEHAEIFNNAYLKAETAKAAPGEKVYFKRREILDGHTCRYCSKLKDMVVLWSEVPLDDEAIDDPHAKVAIWEGKSNVGRKAVDYWVPAGTAHPHCRGSWERWFPPAGSEKMNKKIAEILERKEKRDKLYNEAIWEVRQSMKDSSPGFEQEVNRVYTEKLTEAGLL